MTKTVEEFEVAINAAVDPWVTTLKSATMLASIMMKPLVKELEESDIDPELKKALFDRVMERFTDGAAEMEKMFDDD